MRDIYIFNITSRSIRYGIGTYIRQLIRCIKHNNMRAHYVLISDEVKEFEVKERAGVRYFNIPLPIHRGNSMHALAKTEESLVYLLQEYIVDDENNIFHFNIMRQESLITRMRKQYKGKFILTVHYTDWSFELLGDRKKLMQIIHKQSNQINFRESFVAKSFEKDKRVLNEHVDRVVAIAQHSYDDITGMYGVDPKKVTLINNALPDKCKYKRDRNEMRTRYRIAPDENVVIFAGRLDEVKGIQILIHAFGLFLNRFPNSRLIIAGEGDYQPLFSSATNNWSKITFTGYIDQKTLYDLYTIADIGVVPSLHEEFGYVAIEMMMHRLPVVVNATTGLAEIIDHEVNGLHVTLKRGKHNIAYSAKVLTEALVRLTELPQLRANMGKMARKKYLACYSTPLFNEKMSLLYKTL